MKFTEHCCDPDRLCHRLVVLFFMCFLGFGPYFCYDNPSALMNYFLVDLKLSVAHYSLLYSMSSWPNVVLCLLGGFLIDRVFGVRFAAIVYMMIALVGQILFAFGALENALWIMVAGRLLFGIGGESLAVAQNGYAVLWFNGKELNMMFGFQLSFARLGSSVNFWIMEPMYKIIGEYYKGYKCLGIVIFIAGSTCVFSMVCALVLGYLDKRAERLLNRKTDMDEVMKLSEIKNFPLTFWLINVIFVFYNMSVFPFIAIGKQFFITVFHADAHAANTINSMLYLISAIASPFSGLLIDKTGNNISYALLSITLTLIPHLLLTLTQFSPYVAMCIMGLSYSMLTSGLWPLVAVIIPKYQFGTAYGICQALQNLGLAIALILAGCIIDEFGYFWVEIFFAACLLVSFLATMCIWVVNVSRAGVLNMTPAERDKHIESTDYNKSNRSYYSMTVKKLVYSVIR